MSRVKHYNKETNKWEYADVAYESGGSGEDGFSPIAKVTQTTEGAVIEITDKDGTTTATIVNGTDGKDGVSATHSWNGTTLTITSASGTSYTDLKGEQGPKGNDGTSVVILGSFDTEEALFAAHKTGNIGDSYLVNGSLYVWSASENTWKNVGNIQGPKGDTGYTPIKGVDYWIPSDIADMVDQVVSNMYGRGTSIPSDSDLDTYTINGKYYATNEDIAKSLDNCPTSQNFSLFVFERTKGTKTQFIIDLTGRMYARGASSSGWRTWVRVVTSADGPANVLDFGAVGDGVTDDTAAFQAALDTGRAVYIPAGKRFRIIDTLHIKTAYQNIYGENVRGSVNAGSTIYFDPSGETKEEKELKVLFSIEHHDIYFNDICILGKDQGDKIGYGIAFQCNYRTENKDADRDIEFVNVRVYLVTTAIDFEGRGVKVMNCTFATLQNVFIGNWDENEESNDEGVRCPGTGQRGYVFQNNRFHSIRQRFIKIDSGHAYGLVFENNVMDHGKGLVFEVAEEAWNWIVNGNVMQAMVLSKKDNEATEKLATCTFHGGAKNCIFANNVLSSKNNYHTSTVGVIPYYYMKFASLTDSVILGNSFDNCTRDAIVVSGAISNSVVSGNVFTNIGGEEVSFGNSADFEWENPPMELDVEYRTTKRHLGKMVYTKAYSWGNLPAAADTSSYTKFSDTDVKPISVKLILDDGYVASTGYNIDRNHSTKNGFYVGNSTKSITVVTEGDFSKRSAIGVVEYTKN